MVKMTQPKLYTRGKKLWVRFSLNGEVIKKSLNIESNKANEKLANTQLIPQMLLKAHSGEFFKKTIVPTVNEMINISLTMNKANRKESTNYAYEKILKRYVSPVFGKRKIDSIKPSELKLWQNNLLERISSRTTIGARVIYHGIFEDALRDEIITKNPFSVVKSPKVRIARENKPFSKEEIFKLLKASNPKFTLFFALGFFTGMRTGEILGLKWSDIDIENKSIKVQRTRNRGLETLPKTQSSIREIDIIDVLIPYIIKHQQYKCDREYLFLKRYKEPFKSTNVIAKFYWKPLFEKLDIEYRNLYQMRHSFASMMIANAEDILWVSNMLGHKDSSITLQVYAKYIKNDKKQRATFLLN